MIDIGPMATGCVAGIDTEVMMGVTCRSMGARCAIEPEDARKRAIEGEREAHGS